MKVKPEIIELFYKSNKYMWGIYQLKEKNKVSEQTVIRWLKNNSRELLIYPNLLILLEAVNKFDIQEILINTEKSYEPIIKQNKLL